MTPKDIRKSYAIDSAKIERVNATKVEQTKGKKSLRIGKVNDRFQAQMLKLPNSHDANKHKN